MLELLNPAYVPEIFLVSSVLLHLIFYTLGLRNQSDWWIGLILVGSFFLYVVHPYIGFSFLENSEGFYLDRSLLCVKGLMILSGLPIILGKKDSEYHMILVLGLIGVMVLMSGESLITIYLGLELIGLGSYLLATYDKERKSSLEAGMKYYILGALASGLVMFGFSLMYGMTGMVKLERIFEMTEMNPGILIGLLLVLIGFMFKLASVPFHLWVPDVYEGVSIPVAAFFSVVPKLGLVVVMARMVESWIEGFGGSYMLEGLLLLGSLLSMIIGGLGAVYQKKVKRLLAYSTILNTGFVLMGLGCGSITSVKSSVLYSLIYMVTNSLIFVSLMGIGKDDIEVSDLRGLGYKSGWLGIGLGLGLFSLAGLPPMGGFMAKVVILMSGMEREIYGLVAIGLGMSVIGVVYYLRLVQKLFFEQVPNVVLDPKYRVLDKCWIIIAMIGLIGFMIGGWRIVGELGTMGHP